MDRRDEDLDRILRLGTGEAREEFVGALASGIRRELRKGRGRARSVRVAIVVGVTAVGIAALGAVGATGSVTSALADAVNITFSPRDEVHVVLNSPAQDEYQQPSLAVSNVVISSAAPGSTSVSGSFVISNESGGNITSVNLEWVELAFESLLPGGGSQSHTDSCTTNPGTFPYTLAPNEAKTFTFTCTINPAVPANANELKVTVSTKAQGRDKIFSDTGGISF